MFKYLSIIAVLVGAGASNAVAQSSDPGWLDSLRLQLSIDQNCQVQYFLNIRERNMAAGNRYSARVQCEDGRQFDATLTEPATDFTIEACGRTVCEVESKDKDKS